MGQKGLDFKHKEVVNITDGRRLRLCTRCNSRFRNRSYYIHDGCKKENRCNKFEFIRKIRRSGCVTRNGEKRTGYVEKERYEYDIICKIEL